MTYLKIILINIQLIWYFSCLYYGLNICHLTLVSKWKVNWLDEQKERTDADYETLYVVLFECENKIKNIFPTCKIREYQIPYNYFSSFLSYLAWNSINWKTVTPLKKRCELKTIMSWLGILNAIIMVNILFNRWKEREASKKDSRIMW